LNHKGEVSDVTVKKDFKKNMQLKIEDDEIPQTSTFNIEFDDI
jgi:hypothetical protein